MSKLKVCAQQCSQCLFGPDKIVSDVRRRQILKDCAAKDTHFICHKSDDTVCAGFYKSKTSNLIRIMQRLNGIEFVGVEDDAD